MNHKMSDDVDAANVARQQAADGTLSAENDTKTVLFNHIAAKRGLAARAQSAGIAAQEGAPASAHAQEALREWELDLSAHVARQLTLPLLESAGAVFVMTESHRQTLAPVRSDVRLLSESGIADPFFGNLDDYRTCRDQLQSVLIRLFDEGMFS